MHSMPRNVGTEQKTLMEFWLQLQNFLNTRRRAARAAGVAPSEYEVMLTLMALSDSDPNISTVGRRLLVQHRAAARLIKRLARQGMVRAERSHSDRRSVVLRLTAKGQRVLNHLAANSLQRLATEAPPLVHSLRRMHS
jgi:DNA-binding MarR family transcriptional regulator